MILIQEIIREVVSRVSVQLGIDINYQCGDAQYVKDQLNILSNTPHGEEYKYPLFVLYMPIKEDKSDPKYYCKVSLRMLIATLSEKGLSYEQRLEYSFREQLHPIYEAFIAELKRENRLDHEYLDFIPHEYVDNYQYGYHGTKVGENQDFEVIDGIDITNLKLRIKHERICKKLPNGREI